MGTLRYHSASEFDIDDRALAHLQVVIVDKLRRMESFRFNLDDGRSEVSLWMSPATPLEFIYHGNRPPSLNRRWLEMIAYSAGSNEGMELVPEPAPDAGVP